MNVQRFTGRNAREAMAKVRAAFGVQAVVLANRPIPEGVEILAIPGVEFSAGAGIPDAGSIESVRKSPERHRVAPMSTMSFENYVRERQKRQDAEPPTALAGDSPEVLAAAAKPCTKELGESATTEKPSAKRPADRPAEGMGETLIKELRCMQSALSSQLASLAWFDAVRRSPVQTQLLRLLLGNGFSPGLARHLVDRMPVEHGSVQSTDWIRNVIAQNLRCAGEDDGIAQTGGIYALVGPTGVGKTTTTAKIAANFAQKHGVASVGLITMDTYRMAASDQLRAFGRLLGIPVHTARDATSLGDLLDLFEKKKLVLIDTVGASQRDQRISDIFSCLPDDRVVRLMVLNAAAQAETLDEVVHAYGTGAGTRCVITKLDEAVQAGGVLDVAVRHHLVIEGFANGQRVPEDWHPARSQLLTQKALMKRTHSIFTAEDAEIGLVMTSPQSEYRRTDRSGNAHA